MACLEAGSRKKKNGDFFSKLLYSSKSICEDGLVLEVVGHTAIQGISRHKLDKPLNKPNIYKSCYTINLSPLILNTSIPVFAERDSVHNTMIDDIFIILPSLASFFYIPWGAGIVKNKNSIRE